VVIGKAGKKMNQRNDCREDIFTFIRPYMEERCQESCREIQKELEKHGYRMWNELRELIQEIITEAANMQEQNQKGKAAYLLCSFLQSSAYLDRPLLRIEVLDEGFYLDEQEASGHYCSKLLQHNYQQDLEFLHRKVYEKFVRVQNHQLQMVNQAYIEYYDAILFEIVQSLCRLIMRTIVESELCLSDEFQIVYGKYMGSATVLFKKEKYEEKHLCQK